jgi:hypothetical protein
MELVDRATGKEPSLGYLSTILDWHCKYPVSNSERRRNDKVHSWQGNCNFAIDHPEFVESIWNFECAQRTPKNVSEAEAASMFSATARFFANLFGREVTNQNEEL